ncbi:hypothetical protein AB5J62_03660 [Amycolatopsis sp. cg5]|uniref:hypothetical protein n=1 Tax=Amycolatopsis sp. cg5 TaxID=3238802 RepID=UPI0035242FBE
MRKRTIAGITAGLLAVTAGAALAAKPSEAGYAPSAKVWVGQHAAVPGAVVNVHGVCRNSKVSALTSPVLNIRFDRTAGDGVRDYLGQVRDVAPGGYPVVLTCQAAGSGRIASATTTFRVWPKQIVKVPSGAPQTGS